MSTLLNFNFNSKVFGRISSSYYRTSYFLLIFTEFCGCSTLCMLVLFSIFLNALENVLIVLPKSLTNTLINIPAIFTAHESGNKECILDTKGLLDIHRILKRVTERLGIKWDSHSICIFFKYNISGI